MRVSLVLLVALGASGAHASWFGNDKPEYSSWDDSELRQWLQVHNIQAPASYSSAQLQDLVKSNWDAAASWTADQYTRAQQVFQGVKDDSFAAWDESRLREFLLEQGVVEPSGPREHLALLAKQKYKAYQRVSSSLSAAASTAVYGDKTQQASKSATSAASVASASVSSAASVASESFTSGASVVSASASSMYSVASASASSAIAQATAEVARKADDTKDYVYSTWDESVLRQYLQEKGVVEPKVLTTREKMLAKMQEVYLSSTQPIWNAWSDSYIREWLVAHDVIHSTPETQTEHLRQAIADNLNRDALAAKMSNYYYDTKDTAYSNWDESQLKAWLVEHNVIKSDAQIQREKLVRLVSDNYANAQDTLWAAWTDSQMREWLIEQGYVRTDAQKARDELIKLMNQKYNDTTAKTASYLVWPDARLRAYLRNRGVSEDALPTSRPGLLQEVRIRWVQTSTRAEWLLARIRAIINCSIASVEDKIGEIIELLTGHAHATHDAARTYSAEKAGEASDAYDAAEKWAGDQAQWAGHKAESASHGAGATGADTSGTVMSKVATASGQVKGAKEWFKGKASSASHEGAKATESVKAEL